MERLVKSTPGGPHARRGGGGSSGGPLEGDDDDGVTGGDVGEEESYFQRYMVGMQACICTVCMLTCICTWYVGRHMMTNVHASCAHV